MLDPDTFRTPLTEEDHQCLRIRHRVAEQDFTRRRSVAGARQVVLGQERIEDLLFTQFTGVNREKCLVPQVQTAADEENLHAGMPALHVAGDDVELPPGRADILVLLYLPQADNLVPVLRGALIIQPVCCLLHGRGQFPDHFLVAAFQEHDRMFYVFPVIPGADQSHAGRGAALDLVLQAGPGTIPEEGVIALPDPEQLLGEVQGAAGGLGAGIRTEILPCPGLGAAVETQPGKFIVSG